MIARAIENTILVQGKKKSPHLCGDYNPFGFRVITVTSCVMNSGTKVCNLFSLYKLYNGILTLAVKFAVCDFSFIECKTLTTFS